MHILQMHRGIVGLEDLGIEPDRIDPHLIGDAAMGERFVE